MNGVTILTEQAIYNSFLPEWCITAALICIATCLVLVFVLFANDWIVFACVCAILCVGSVCTCVFGSMENENDIAYIEYKVAIDDSVLMNEFLDKYEIIEQEGKIYTVREKIQ